MKDLLIVCAGGYGKEALDIAQRMNKVAYQWDILGFLDDTMDIGTEIFRGYKVVGSISAWEPASNQLFAMGISKPKAKEMIYAKLKSKGAEFATLINPETYIPEETVLGEGCVIGRSWIGLNVVLGKCVNIAGSMVGGSFIDDFSTTTGFANIAGAQIGKRVFVGSHAVVLNNRKVGDDVQICAGSAVYSNIKSGTTVFGVPAKKILL